MAPEGLATIKDRYIGDGYWLYQAVCPLRLVNQTSADTHTG